MRRGEAASCRDVMRAFVMLALAACSPAVTTPGSAPTPASNDDPITFERGEDEVLRDLAAIDGRFARRARLEPTEEDLRRVAMTAILHEDPTLAVNDGAIDPFSFDARARGLDAINARLASLPKLGIEHELLLRLVEGEVARLEEERALPRSASALVHAIVDAWTPPKDERELAEDDRWLARRLAEVRASMSSSVDPNAQLDVVRARDLDDALDALERLTTGYIKATQELVLVRDALESVASRPAAKAHSEWRLVGRRLRTQVGVATAPESLADSFTSLEKDLRVRAEAAVAGAKLSREALRDALDRTMFVAGACVDAVPGSRARAMAAPREREAACQLRKLVARADDDRARAIALAAMHDHVVVASWALDVARGAGTIADAESKHHLLLPVLPDTRARLERIALARPTSAIAAGEVVRLLGTAEPAIRAKAWAALGDVPLDIAARELP